MVFTERGDGSLKGDLHQEILLEMALSISGEFELEVLLKNSLPIFLRKLNCSLAGVVQQDVHVLHTSLVLPRVMHDQPLWEDLVNALIQKAASQDQDNFVEVLKREQGLYYGFSLSGFGMLILGRKTVFDPAFLNELKHIIKMLSRACRACMEALQRRQAEQTLQMVQAQQKALLDNLPFSAWLKDTQGNYLAVNEFFCRESGLSRKDILGKNALQVWPESTGRRYVQQDTRIMQSGDKMNWEDLIQEQGSKKWVEFYKTPIFDSDGNIVGLCGFKRDITERKRMEESLRKSQELYRGIVESQTDMVVRVDEKGRFTYVNDAYCQAFGKTREELIGSTFMPLIHKDDLEPTMEAMKLLEVPPYRAYMEQRAKTVHGWRWLAWEDYAIRDKEGRISEIQGVGRDITAQKEAEKDLKTKADLEAVIARISSRFVNLGAENIDEAILSSLREMGEFLSMDRVYVFEFETSRTMLNSTYEWCSPGIASQSQYLQNVPAGVVSSWMEKMFFFDDALIEDVSKVTMLDTANDLSLPEEECAPSIVVPLIWESSLEGFICFDSKDQKQDWNDKGAVPFYMLAGILVNSLKRKETEEQLRQSRNELRHLNATLEQKVEERSRQLGEVQQRLILGERMAAIGQLAAGIAHELNNPVGFVSMNFETLQEEIQIIVEVVQSYKKALGAVPGSREQERLLSQAFELEKKYSLDFVLSDLDKLFEQSRDGFQRISKIVNSMRNFSRSDSGEEFILFDLNRGLRDTLVLAHNNYKNHAEIQTELNAIPEIECVPGEINQVFLNIVVNAAQALEDAHMPRPGTIKVRTWADDNHVYCDIFNDGPTIEEEVRKRIFDAFFTTKPTGRGTGLGLSISYDIIVRKHNGILSVDSNEQDGTTFHIVLPVRQKRG